MASNAGEQQCKGKGKKGGKPDTSSPRRPLSGNESVDAMVDGSAHAKGKGKASHRVVSPGTTKGNELPSPGKAGKGKSKASQPLSKGTGDQSSLAAKGPAKGKSKSDQATSPNPTPAEVPGKGKAKTAQQPAYPAKGKSKTDQATSPHPTPAEAPKKGKAKTARLPAKGKSKAPALKGKGQASPGKGKCKSKRPASPPEVSATFLASPVLTAKLESAETLVDPDLNPDPTISNLAKKGKPSSKGKGTKSSTVDGQAADTPQTLPAKCVREANAGDAASPSSTTVRSPGSLSESPPAKGHATQKGKHKAADDKGKAGKTCKGGSKSPGSKSNVKVVATTALATPDKGKGHGNAQGVKRGSDFESDGSDGVRRRCSFASSTSGAFMCHTVIQDNRFAIEVLDFCKASMPQFAGDQASTSSTPEPLGNHNLTCLTQALCSPWCLLPHKAS